MPAVLHGSTGLAGPQVTSEPKPPYPEQRQKYPGRGLGVEMEARPRFLAPHYNVAGKLEDK